MRPETREPGHWDPGTRDPGSPKSLKVEAHDPLRSLKVGPPPPRHLSLMNSFFFQNISSFFY